MKISHRIFLHAPNVHVGGGLVLLKGLLASVKLSLGLAILDQRAENNLPVFDAAEIVYVPRTIFGRFFAEWRLWKKSKSDDVVLCFHGLPPLFPVRGKTIVFLQNRILVTRDSLSGYTLRTRARLSVERFFLRVFAARIDKFIVQTPSMAKDVFSVLGPSLSVEVFPFYELSKEKIDEQALEKIFDFVYVSSGEFHKNHRNLLEAWKLLAESDILPSLALTLPDRSVLSEEVDQAAKRHGLKIVNVGVLETERVNTLYRQSRALIYPSTSESFGLPLVEARNFGLPVLAPELDYVRDVVEPVQTFDPLSPVSITRAVRRYLECPEPTVTVRTSEEFIAKYLP